MHGPLQFIVSSPFFLFLFIEFVFSSTVFFFHFLSFSSLVWHTSFVRFRFRWMNMAFPNRNFSGFISWSSIPVIRISCHAFFSLAQSFYLPFTWNAWKKWATKKKRIVHIKWPGKWVCVWICAIILYGRVLHCCLDCTHHNNFITPHTLSLRHFWNIRTSASGKTR